MKSTISEKMQVVVDTNVIISGIIKPDNSPAKILNAILSRKLILNLDSRIFSEYERILKSLKFSFPENLVSELLYFIKKESYFTSPSPVQIEVKDKNDLPFIELAIHKNIPIITGNKKHFEISNEFNLTIFTPSEFINTNYNMS
jgi:uncharacterized protein